jgi:hypothetical protein
VYQKFPDWPPVARNGNGTALCHWVQLYRYFVSQSSEFCRHNPLCCFSMSVYFYFVIDSVRKLLDITLCVYIHIRVCIYIYIMSHIPRLKQPEREASYSYPTSAYIQNV